MKRPPRALVLAGLLALAGCIRVPPLAPPQAGPPTSKTRLLVIALDAVPFDAAVRAFDAAPTLFERFDRPLPVLSTFPSTTTLAFTDMFRGVGLATPPGYEAKFYDRDLGRVRGGGLVAVVVSASKTSATAVMRPSIGMSSPAKPRG